MKRLVSAITLLLSAAVQSAPASSDPFTPGGSSWIDEVVAAKPFTLEICFREVDVTTAPDNPARLVTPEFLESSSRLRIAVAAADQGIVEAQDGVRVIYRLTPESGNHHLEILATRRDAESGLREMNSRLTLLPDRWLIMDGYLYESVTGDKGAGKSARRSMVIAVRLAASAPAP
jgi:hypothetical protein